MSCWLSDINSSFVKSLIGLHKTDALSTLGNNDDDVHLGGHASTSDKEDDDGDVAINDDEGIHLGG